MHIDRCYCFQKTFAELRSVSEDARASSVQELQEHVVFGQNCRLCHPYVRRMLRTGETRFNHVIRDEDEPAGRDSQPLSG